VIAILIRSCFVVMSTLRPAVSSSYNMVDGGFSLDGLFKVLSL